MKGKSRDLESRLRQTANIRPKVTFSTLELGNEQVQTLQNNCYGLDCADTTTESASDENCARVPRGGGVTPYNGLCGEAPTERGTFFLFQVYERIGLLLVLFFADRFFSGCSGFPLSPKTNLCKFQFDPQRRDSFKRVLNNFSVLRGKTNYRLQC